MLSNSSHVAETWSQGSLSQHCVFDDPKGACWAEPLCGFALDLYASGQMSCLWLVLWSITTPYMIV